MAARRPTERAVGLEVPSGPRTGRRGLVDLIAAVGLVGLLLAAGAPILAQTAAGEGASEEVRPEPLPPIGELVPRVQELSRGAADATRRIVELVDVADLTRQIDGLAEEREEVGGSLERALAHEPLRDDRVRRLLDRALFLQKRIDDAVHESATRLQILDQIAGAWRERRERWRLWRKEGVGDPVAAPVYDDQIERALEVVNGVLDAAADALSPLVRVQRRLQELDVANRDAMARAEGMLRTRREALFRPTAPILLSAAHQAELRSDALAEIKAGIDGALAEGLASSPRDGGVLLIQIVLVLTLGWGLGRLRRRVPTDSRWVSALGRPWAIGVMVAMAGLGPLYGPLPPMGRLALVTALAVSASRVASGMFANPAKRSSVYAVSAAFVILSALEATAVPTPALRLVLAGGALLGVLVLLLLDRRAAHEGGGDRLWFDLVLYLGGVILALTFGAELLGYHVLAQWLLESAVVTGFVAFVSTFLIRLARGGLDLALRSEKLRTVELVSRVGRAVRRRVLFLVKLVILASAGLYLLSVWDLADTPGKAWNALIDAGVRVGEGELTVGGLLLAALAVYLATSVSWVLRTVLDRTLFEHRRFERGVRDSISTLLHYSIIVVGVLLALAVLGVDLSSFALIAGALGVGVGFGLQNVVNNFVSGLILLFERPVRVGDTVVLGEQLGTISKIGLRSTVLTTFDGAEMIVPNADLISEKVVNWTLTTSRARLVLPVSVAYGNEPARVIELLEEIGRSLPESLEEPAPGAVFIRFGDSSLDFELRVWLESYDQLLAARNALASLLAARLEAEGIEIPFPQRDVHLRRPEAEPVCDGDRDPDQDGPGEPPEHPSAPLG